jgi:hypothetical protein
LLGDVSLFALFSRLITQAGHGTSNAAFTSQPECSMPFFFSRKPAAQLGRLAIGLMLIASATAPVGAQSWVAQMSGAREVPPNASPGTGFALFSLSGPSLNVLNVSMQWSGLQTPLAAAHIHCCATPDVNAGVVIGFTGLSETTSGSYDAWFDLDIVSTYRSAFVTANGGTVALAKARLLDGMQEGGAYVNLHTVPFPGGEIRGQIAPVPEPSGVALAAVGLVGLAAVARRRRTVEQ